ncbi:hypothetical protein JCM6882_002099 [Rhodosporidiobolus microsporus]
MLDRLPLELVQHVVQLAIPSRASYATHLERQRTLLALCKTSRLLRAVAQPLLFEVVTLEGEGAIESFVEKIKAGGKGGMVRTVRLFRGVTGILMLESKLAETLALACPSVVAISLCSVFADWECFQAFPTLHHLVLCFSSLRADSPCSLPQVEELSIFGCSGEDAHLFSPTFFPSLRALHYNVLAYNPHPSTVFDRLLPQLEVLSYEALAVNENNSTSPCLATDKRVVLDLDVDYLDHPALKLKNARTIRLNAYSFLWHPHTDPNSVDAAALRRVGDAVTRGTMPNLKLLIVPPTFKPSSSSPEVAGQYNIALGGLQTICVQRSIEVLLEDLPHTYYESLVSPAFWRRCKGLKAQEEARGERT